MTEDRVDIGACLRDGFELYRANVQILLLSNLLAFALSVVTFGILAGPMQAGVAWVTLAVLDRRSPQPQAADVFRGIQRFFLPSFLLSLMLTVPLATVALATSGAGVFGRLLLMPLLTAGSLVVATLTMFSMFLIVERGLDFWPAVTASYAMVRERFWPLLGIMAAAAAGGAAGSAACCIGALVTMPFATAVLAVTWRRMAGAPASAASGRGD